MRDIIEINNLSKSFGEVKAVDNLSIRIKEGELYAFLGVNGAGKSTTISMMCGQLSKDQGEIFIDGEEMKGHAGTMLKKIGVVFQNSVLDQTLTVKDNLKNRATLYGLSTGEIKERIEELSNILDFKDILGRTVGKLSGGQRRRIDIARALIHNPQILILDEPTTGLDPKTRQNLWDVISTMRKKRNLTVFLTTHYMEEAVDADYVVIINEGKIVAEGTPLDLKNKYTGDFITIYGSTDNMIEKLGAPYKKINGAYRISISNTEKATEMIIKDPELFKDYEIVKGRMDDVFLAATGIKLEGDDK